MSQSTKDKVKGKVEEAKGAIKEKVGQITNNPDLEAEGTEEKITGKVRQKVADVEKAFEKSGS
jgi:uncharacterized protein YjbJ (UPF0337 family)